MSTIVERYKKINSNILSMKSDQNVNVIAVSKTFSLEHVKPLIDYGHIHLEKIKCRKLLQSGQ